MSSTTRKLAAIAIAIGVSIPTYFVISLSVGAITGLFLVTRMVELGSSAIVAVTTVTFGSTILMAWFVGRAWYRSKSPLTRDDPPS